MDLPICAVTRVRQQTELAPKVSQGYGSLGCQL